MNITELIKRAHENAVNKGFYECAKCHGTGRECDNGLYCDKVDLKNKTDLSMCSEYCGNSCTVCNGTGKAQKNIGELLMLVVSELGEGLEAHRSNTYPLYEMFQAELDEGIEFKTAFKNHIKDTLHDELADAVIRICDMCGYLGIDLEKHIELKMKYNETREYKHGKNY